MATMVESSVTYLLDEVTSAVLFDAAFDPGAAMVGPGLYTMRESVGRRERISSFAALDVFGTKAETAAADEDEMIQQFQTTFTPVAYAKQIPFSREVADDEEWGMIENLAALFGQAFQQTLESNMAAPFIDAFTGATYLAEDSLSMCNNAHLNGDGGNSQDNYGTNSLTLSGVKTSLIAMRKITNYRGTSKSKLRPDILMVPVDLEVDSWEIVRSAMRPDNANMAANMFNGSMQLVVWDELSDTNAWFLLDSRKMARNLLWLWRTGFETFGDGDLFTGTRKLGAYFRASFGLVDWRFVYGNNPS